MATTDRKAEYTQELEELVASTAKEASEEPDFELELEASIPGEETEEKDDAADETKKKFPERLTSYLGRWIQGRRCGLTVLSTEATKVLAEKCGVAIPVEVVAAKIRLIAERKAYGVSSKTCVLHEDTNPHALWHWEVATTELFGSKSHPVLKDVRQVRKARGQRLKALAKLCDVLTKHPGDLGKISHEEERYLKFKRDDEAARIKAEAQKRKREEKDAEQERKRLKKESGDQKKKDAEESRRLKEEAKQKKDNAAKKQASSFMAFVKKATAKTTKPASQTTSPGTTSKKTTQDSDIPPTTGIEIDLEKIQRPAPMTVAELAALMQEPRTTKKDDADDDDDDEKKDGDDDVAVVGKDDKVDQPKAKFFYFYNEYRGGHWDTSNRTSTVVTATNPFAKDPNIDYDYDSDEEFAVNDAEVEDGEDLEDDDDDDQQDGADYEEDDFLLADDDAAAAAAEDAEDADDQNTTTTTTTKKRKSEDDDTNDAAAKRYRRLLIIGPHPPTAPGVLGEDVPDDLRAYAVCLFTDPKDIRHPEPKAPSRKSKRGPKSSKPAAKKSRSGAPTPADDRGQKSITSFFTTTNKKKPKVPPTTSSST